MLSPVQLTALRSLMDRIIPPDDDPGAWEVGAGDYLLSQFDRDLRDAVPIYRAGLEALEAEALFGAGESFAALPAPDQDALLRRIEAGDVRLTWPVDPAQFFQTVVQHTMEGFYSDPGNGGNRGAAAWRMIGFADEEPGTERA